MSKKYVRWRNMNLPKVEKIQLSNKNITLRAVGAGILILIAVISFGVAISDFLNVQPGWQEITVESDNVNCSTDFIFSYDFTDYGGDASAAYKLLTSLYSEACEDAFRIFTKDVSQEGVYNLAYLNSHPNEVVTVDETLYEALALIQSSGNRHIYLAPVYVEYNRVFSSASAEEAAQFDPTQNPEVQSYIRELVAFGNDPEMIDLELLDNNQVCMRVSDAYLSYAEENQLDAFLDFGWMTNAFIIDYLAERLIEGGYTSGYLSSYDGFTRNLDTRGDSYSFNLFDDKGETIYVPAVFSSTEPISIVFLRDYPLDENDSWHYFDFGDNYIVTSHIDPADGACKSYYDNLVSYSGEAGCAEILMKMIPSYIADDFDPSVFDAWTEEIYTIWFQDYTISHNDPNASIALAESGREVGYTIALSN